jgi:hypothetical protein
MTVNLTTKASYSETSWQVAHSVDTLDKGMILILSRTLQDFHHTTQNDVQFKTYKLFLECFSFLFSFSVCVYVCMDTKPRASHILDFTTEFHHLPYWNFPFNIFRSQ